jgi:hypothetical protein
MSVVCFRQNYSRRWSPLYSATDVLADFVRAPVGRWEERLLSVRALIQAVIECDVR